MMREIIFRAWWKDDNTLVDPKSYVIYPDGTIEFPEGGWDLQGWDSSDLVILEQYTGLKDRNGKMIFEGDIISTDLARDFLVVEFKGGAFVFNCNDGEDDYYDHISASHELDNEYKYGEVIGNIHDQKEDV
jgi:uncharacterized phage protein (TIGR01671 family)